MATIEPYNTKTGKRWMVRYTKPDRTPTKKRGFPTKREATMWMNTLETMKARGDYVDPSAGRVTVRELGEKWIERQADWKDSYRYSMKSTWVTHVLPKWGSWAVADVTRAEVQSWIAGLDRSNSVASRCVTILSSILDDAVADRIIHTNRATNISLPKADLKPRTYLDHTQVQAFADAAGSRGVIILTLAYTGLRWGELAGLSGSDIDTKARRISVNRNAVLVGSRIIVGTPKPHELRTVPLPDFLVPMLEPLRGREIAFPNSQGEYDRPPRASKTKKSWWRTAMLDSGVPELTAHDLRHTAASLAIQSGAHVKAVQRMLGHKSAAMTLDTYSDLFDSDLDIVSKAMDSARAAALKKDAQNVPTEGSSE